MTSLKPFPEERYASLLRKKKKVKICVTISDSNDDTLYALTKFHDHDSCSRIVNDALTAYFNEKKMLEDINKAKEDWRIEWDVFRKKRT